MKLKDKNYKEIKEGQNVSSSICSKIRTIDYNVTEVDELSERIEVKQTTEGNGFGIRKTYNRIECSRYLTVIN